MTKTKTQTADSPPESSRNPATSDDVGASSGNHASSDRMVAAAAVGTVAAIAAGAWMAWNRWRSEDSPDAPPVAAAFADGEDQPENFVQHRSAGPEAMRDDPGEDWDAVDQASDESFPASDPPATY